MSSSRSIAAARNRRSGDPTPKIVSQQPSRPVTSISSQSAFNSQPYPGNNIRVSGKQQNQQANFTQQKTPNGLPFSKLSVSDAIGLVTLRLGRVEQFMIYLQEQEGENGQKMGSLPENTKLMDNSVLNNIISRLDSLEKKESSQEKNDIIVKLQKELDNIKNTLETLSNSLQLYEKNTNDKFIDYENALVEIENKDSTEENKELSEEDNNVVVKLQNESNNIKNILETLFNKLVLHEKNTNEKFTRYEKSIVKDKDSPEDEKESDNIKNILEVLLNKLLLHEKNTNEKFIHYEKSILEIEKTLLPVKENNYQTEEESNLESQVLEESNQESEVIEVSEESETNEIQC